MEKPIITVGLPVYNGEKYIEQSIISILQQTDRNFELIICDNASTDNTQKLCEKYVSNDKRIKYLRNETNIGGRRNFNKVFRLSDSKYFRWQAADDFIAPTLHQECLSTLDNDDSVVLCFGNSNMVDSDSRKLYAIDDDKLNLLQESESERFIQCYENLGFMTQIFGLVRTSALKQTDLLGNFTAADYNLILELSILGKIKKINSLLFYRRMHEEASSWKRTDIDWQKKFYDPESKKNSNPNLLKRYIALYKYVLTAPIASTHKIKIIKFLIKPTIRLFLKNYT